MLRSSFILLASISLGFSGTSALPASASTTVAPPINLNGTHYGELFPSYRIHATQYSGNCIWSNPNSKILAFISQDLYENWPGYVPGNPNNHPV
ncbi:rare lipoprotein A-like double-psi beta-barrel protein [Ceratobasidium sp. AG-Ba]|nr:rare lipoprotein A-like double-psi beta-barrel protein [Ceratobasidium sp. AG-Ba]QRW09814.1 hypothetical protein RhiLY_08813 [Ceratobasidium sp. AG-Ba]